MRLSGIFLGFVALLGCKRPTGEPAGGAASAPPAASSAAEPSASAARAAPRHSGPVTPHPSASAVVSMSDAAPADDGKPPEVTPASVGLPTVSSGAPGPLVIRGYPVALQLGMADYVTEVGYSKDGKQLIACGALDPSGDSCFVNEGAKTRSFQTAWDGGDGPGSHRPEPGLIAAKKALNEGTRLLLRRGPDSLLPPPLSAAWPYAADITLDASASGGVAMLGGSYAGEPPVYSVRVSVPRGEVPLEYTASVNAIIANPAGDELGLVAHFFCGEWCNPIALTRVGHGAMAALVYNDTGFRHHKKKEYAQSRDLFLKATWANPRASLPPYNLACAYALLGDAANAEKALKLAIAVGGPKIKERARKDADFKAVLTAPWFRALTG